MSSKNIIYDVFPFSVSFALACLPDSRSPVPTSVYLKTVNAYLTMENFDLLVSDGAGVLRKHFLKHV